MMSKDKHFKSIPTIFDILKQFRFSIQLNTPGLRNCYFPCSWEQVEKQKQKTEKSQRTGKYIISHTHTHTLENKPNQQKRTW